MEIPNISVIIPLYNAKEYIGKCLDSLLAQTFQNFEVIVVNDCSTDKSADIVESFKEKFGERLKLTNTEKNSGGCGFVPRNVGLGLASGEYVFFVDADDYLAENALTILYTAAKENEAEVVYTATCYYLRNAKNFKIIKDSKGHELQKKDEELKPTLIVNEPDKNINRLFSGEDFRTAWTKFVQRDFLIKNKILFPEITTGGDYIWSMNIFCHASRVLRLFVPVYFRRSYSPGLVERKALSPSSKIYFWVSAFVAWLKALNRLANKNEILRKDSAQYYRVSSDYFKYCLEQISDEVLNRFYSKDTHEILFREFLKRKDSSYLTVPFLFSAIANREKNINKNQKQLDQLTVDVDRQQKKINSMESHLRPLVSIIIPMYNAEKFIGEALDSLLAQTLENFEVLVVDDCSKDNSYKVVEKYIPKFNGRLKLLKMAKNSGHPGIPRNKGIDVSRGDYIYCLDSDDTLTKTALEEMYTLAKEYDADVVYCEKYYWSEGIGEDFVKNIRLADNKIQNPPFVNKPTLETNDMAERIGKWLKTNYWMSSALRLVQRDLLIENNIKFPLLIGSEDDVWFLETLFCSKRFLRIPNVCFIRRIHEGGISFGEYTTPNLVQRWMDILIRGLKELDNFMEGLQFFRDCPDFRYVVFSNLLFRKFEMIYKRCNELKSFELYTIFLDKFSEYLGKYDVLVSFLCTHIFEQNKILKTNRHFFNFAQVATPKSPKKRISTQETPIKRLPANGIPPAVSVVISLFNYGKYIGECLDSILAQTFQNFEAIVVDDCSTDNGVEVVESYVPKFNGRLILAQTEKNSGGGGEPRNIGLSLALGEYVFFMDADDVFTKTALDEMYTLAKEYDAEVVYCEHYYMSEGVGQDFINNIHAPIERLQKPPFVDKPTLETDDFVERTRKAILPNYWMTPWLRLVQRKLLIENDIKFDSLIASNDVAWTFRVLFCSKRFLRVPNACYIRRIHNESVSFRKRTPAEYIHKWMDLSVRGIKDMDNFLDGIEFFRENLKCRHDVLDYFVRTGMSNCFKECQKLPKSDVYLIFRQTFNKYLGENDVLVSNLFARVFDQGRWWYKRYDTLKKDSETRIAELKDEIARLKDENDLLKIKQSSLTESPSQIGRPAISVVIPMYNAEEFIGECLDSLLIQTFQDFEVIVADDCSVDNSVKIVESYAPKFDGRLQITQTSQNSGGGGYIPRNIGLELASGEYVIFLDSDDFLLGSALETLYLAAKKNDADVVYSSIYYDVRNPNDVYLHRDGLARKLLKEGVKEKPVLTVDDTDKIFQEFLLPGSGEGNFRAPWSKFVRRDFLIQNEILFPDIITGGDCIWCINVYAHAKRFLRLPISLYFYRRYNSTSITRTARTPKEQLAYWVSSFMAFLKAANDLQNRTIVLKEHPNYCYEATHSGHFKWFLNRTQEARKELSSQEVYEILYRELGKEKELFESALPFFSAVIDNEKQSREDSSQTIKDLQKEIDQLKKSKN